MRTGEEQIGTNTNLCGNKLEVEHNILKTLSNPSVSNTPHHMYLLDTHNQINELPTRGGDYQNFRKPREIKKTWPI